MFNYAGLSTNFETKKVLGGIHRSDADTHRTLFAGPDPADNNRVLIRKIIQINHHTYAYEETRINRDTPNKHPTVHTTITKIAGFDLNEKLTNREINLRGLHRSMPNILGYSLYYRKTFTGANHFSIVENSLWKTSGSSWAEWW